MHLPWRPWLRTTSALAFVAAAPWATATTVDFNYTSTAGGSECATCTTTGTGSFSFDGTPATVSLSDLTGFSLVNDFGEGNTFFTYGLGDLASFLGTFDADANVLTLSLATDYVDGVGPNNFPEALIVDSLNDARTNSAPPVDPPDLPYYANLTVGVVSTGTVSDPGTGNVPEPMTPALVAIALAGLAWSRRRGASRAAV